MLHTIDDLLCVAAQAADTASALLHSVYIDWCFKLPHLKRADKSGPVEATGTRAPPNAAFFIPDTEVQEHLGLQESRQPLPDDGKMCSDFKADEVRLPTRRVVNAAFKARWIVTCMSLLFMPLALTLHMKQKSQRPRLKCRCWGGRQTGR